MFVIFEHAKKSDVLYSQEPTGPTALLKTSLLLLLPVVHL
jgi:hypothetical protein